MSVRLASFNVMKTEVLLVGEFYPILAQEVTTMVEYRQQFSFTFLLLDELTMMGVLYNYFVIVSRFSKGDIDQHIAMCCSSEDIGNDDAFW